MVTLKERSKSHLDAHALLCPKRKTPMKVRKRIPLPVVSSLTWITAATNAEQRSCERCHACDKNPGEGGLLDFLEAGVAAFGRHGITLDARRIQVCPKDRPTLPSADWRCGKPPAHHGRLAGMVVGGAHGGE
jgi:hypothetical protein